jgi:hypothetical protein
MLIDPDPNRVNTRGCGPLMKYWFRRGFWVNIFMSLFGIFVGVYMLFVFQRNRKEFVQLRDEADDRKRMIRAHSTASVHSTNNKEIIKTKPKANTSGYTYTGMKNSSSNGAPVDYDSDNNSSSVLYRPPPMFDPNA